MKRCLICTSEMMERNRKYCSRACYKKSIPQDSQLLNLVASVAGILGTAIFWGLALLGALMIVAVIPAFFWLFILGIVAYLIVMIIQTF